MPQVRIWTFKISCIKCMKLHNSLGHSQDNIFTADTQETFSAKVYHCLPQLFSYHFRASFFGWNEGDVRLFAQRQQRDNNEKALYPHFLSVLRTLTSSLTFSLLWSSVTIWLWPPNPLYNESQSTLILQTAWLLLYSLPLGLNLEKSHKPRVWNVRRSSWGCSQRHDLKRGRQEKGMTLQLLDSQGKWLTQERLLQEQEECIEVVEEIKWFKINERGVNIP